MKSQDTDAWGAGKGEEFESQGGGYLVLVFVSVFRLTFCSGSYITSDMNGERGRLFYLVWSVANAHIEVGQLCLNHVSQQHLQSLRFRLSLNPFGNFGSHAGI